MGKIMSFDDLREQAARKQARDDLKSQIRQPQGQPGRSAGHHPRADKYRVAKIKTTQAVRKLIKAHLRRHAVNLKLDEILEEYAPIGRVEQPQQQCVIDNNMDAFKGQGHILGVRDDGEAAGQPQSFDEEWDAAFHRANSVDVSDIRAELDDLELETYGVEDRDVARTAEHYGSVFISGWALIMPDNAWTAMFEDGDDEVESDTHTDTDMNTNTTDADVDEDEEEEEGESDMENNVVHDYDQATWEDILASHGIKIAWLL